ncbi:MAG: FapA family protein [Hungatella sp.]
MKEEKKTNSFLFDLFQKYKGQEEPAQELQPESLPVVPVTLPEDKSYLEPLLELYYLIAQSKADKIPITDIQAFETWMFLPMTTLPFYSEYKKEILVFIKDLCQEIRTALQRIAKEETEYQKKLQQYQQEVKKQTDDSNYLIKIAEPTVLPAIHASVRMKLSKDKMYAFFLALPPYRGGREFTKVDIAKALETSNICFGIDEAVLEKIATDHPYLQLYLIAEGIFPVHGKDGFLIDKIKYSSEIEIREDEKGTADFKNLHLIHSVLKDQILCEIVPPQESCPGMDVTKMLINGRIGKVPMNPSGKNTVISEDGSTLLSLIDGQIFFQNGRFNVEPVLTIKGNVDYGVGNINFPGAVVVYGDVCNGFSINAQGSVTVHGMVEGASITSGGDVIINKGVNGNRSGSIDAKGIVKTSFLENCTVYAEGCIYADSIVICSIFCDDTVFVQGNRGVLIGGKITAYRSVEARMIGSKSCRETTITLGEIPRLYTKKCKLQDDLKETETILSKLALNITYLERIKETLPPEKLGILTQLKEQTDLHQQRKSEMNDALEQLTNHDLNFSACRIKSNMIFPPTKILIGSHSYTVTTVTAKCNIFWAEEGIQMGSLA